MTEEEELGFRLKFLLDHFDRIEIDTQVDAGWVCVDFLVDYKVKAYSRGRTILQALNAKVVLD